MTCHTDICVILVVVVTFPFRRKTFGCDSNQPTFFQLLLCVVNNTPTIMAPPILAIRIIAGVIAAVASLRLGTGIYFWRVTEALERPTYTVVEKLSNGVEIRRYEPYLIAETIVDQGVGFREPTRDGFQACASYIFGRNQKKKTSRGWLSSFVTTSTSNTGEPESEKMAMTAPVRVSGEVPTSLKAKSTSTKTKVSFVLGNQYSLQTAPVPLNPKVKVRQVPAHTLAVKTFAGPPPTDARVEKERAKIQAALQMSNYVLPTSSSSNGETLVYGYHDPFITPNFLRRNEVAVVLEGTV